MSESSVPPYLQPRKPKRVEDLIEECAMAALTHDQPRKVVKRLFDEQQRGKEFHKEFLLHPLVQRDAAINPHRAREAESVMTHPHPDKRHVVTAMRQFILGAKRKFGSARGLGHYHGLLQTYLTAKREVVK